MNGSAVHKQIKDLVNKVDRIKDMYEVGPVQRAAIEDFVELIVKKTLDEVAARAYYSGDRAWSNDLDRQWVELEFGFGKLTEKNVI